MIDHLRKVYKDERMTAHFESEGAASSAQPAAVSEISIRLYEEECRNGQLVDEIEQFKAELNTWGITIEELAGRSPKHERLREMCRDVVLTIAQDPEMMRDIRKKRRLPIKTISEKTGVPYSKLERLRVYLLAALIVKTGDYQCISGYV
jgi:RNA polymerase sigma factor